MIGYTIFFLSLVLICCWLFYRLGYQNGKYDGLKIFERDWKKSY